MTNKLAITISLAAVALYMPSAGGQVGNNTSRAISTSQATFATVDSRGVVPVADRKVLAIPCAPVNSKCQKIIGYLSEKVSKTQNLDAPQIAKLDEKIRAELAALPGAATMRTGLSGTASIACQTQNCLIYTSVLNEENNLFWAVLHPQNEDKEYAPSKAIAIKGSKRPQEIERLYATLRELRSRFSTGISYAELASTTAPLTNALGEVQKHKGNSTFSSGIKLAERTRDLLPILHKTWEISISWRTITCKKAKIIRGAWNTTIGYQDIEGKMKQGLIGCTTDIKKLDTPFGKTTWTQHMISGISKTIDNASAQLKNRGGKIPDIQIQQVISVDRASQY